MKTHDHPHRRPLLTRPFTATTDVAVSLPINETHETKQRCSSDSSTRTMILRLTFVFLIGCISIWASNEAEKGFQLIVLNDVRDHSPAGRRFHLLYVSNDRATRLVLEASRFVETLLYPTLDISQINRKKQVSHVTLRLASQNLTPQNLTQTVFVDSSDKKGKFVINLSPSIMEETNVEGTMLQAIRLAMARVWIFDSCCNAPSSLIDGLVEYVSSRLGSISAEADSEKSADRSVCWKDESPMAVAGFLSYCEERSEGFVKRLNQAMSRSCDWRDRLVDDALGMPARRLCLSYTSRELRDSQ